MIKLRYAHELKEGDFIINDKEGKATLNTMLLVLGITQAGNEVKALIQNFKRENTVIKLQTNDVVMIK
jgi:hypothetical protein